MYKTADDRDAVKAVSADATRQGEFVCAGEDLKDMLAMLSRQFVEHDQRNSAALQDMRGRLEMLGRSAESVREHVPHEYAPAFARIEDGVQHLADRIATVGRERDLAKAAALEEPLPVAPPASVVKAPVDRQSSAAIVTAPAVADVLSVAGNAADPWDRDAAEALAQLYDSGEAALGVPRSEPEVAIAPAPKPAIAAFVAPVAAATMAPALPLVTAPAADGADRIWLEQRFADIATRVEQSLAEMRPDNALLAFDGRLEQLEHRFSNALGDVATRADVEGLRIIEAHINELAAQFERTQAQLGRLDHIELQLGDLMHQVSDERFADLFGQIAPAAHQGPTEDDIEAVAMAVADRVASRLPAHETAASAIEQGSINDLKRLVEGFVAGQRETEEHTTTMLDTMQQAMIRMLDRMDALEHAAPAYPAAPAAFVAPAAPVAHAPAAPVHRVEPTLAPMQNEPVAEGEAAAVVMARPAPQNKEDFRAAAVADARRAARKVASQSGDGAAAAAAESGRVRRGAPAVEIQEPTPEPEQKPRSRTPLMVAGIALVAAIGLLAASVGFNRAGPGVSAERQTAQQQKAPLAVDNGSVETSAGELAEGAPRSATPTPSIEAGKGQARPAPAAAPQRPGASLADPRGVLRNNAETALEGSGEGASAAPAAVPQEAAYRTPPTTGSLGMVVTTPSAPPPGSDLARMRQQRNMASLANQLQAIQANAPTLPASMMPDSAAPVVAEAEAVAPAEMPPALIGPNSLRLAAKNGDPSAEFEVAARFAEGRGVTQDFKQANTWYSRSAQRGFAPAQYRLGTLYERGIGAKADVARAKIWYGRAAEQGHVKAMHNLAVLNAGREQSADYAAAVHWFTQAAERGLADSQFNLGVLYESGLGLQRDLKQAYHWLSLAARTGDKEAARRRDQVRMKLDEADAATADEAVNGWRAKAVDMQVNEARAAGEAWKQRQAAR